MSCSGGWPSRTLAGATGVSKASSSASDITSAREQSAGSSPPPGSRPHPAQRADEEPPGRCQVAALGQQYAKDLAMLINRPVQVRPPAGDLHVSLVGEPPVAGSVTAGTRRLDELGSEPLDPPVNDDVIPR